jgi:Domain of unknown function (DUF4157)
MELRFGRDLSTVRVHSGQEAVAAAKALNAKAFTVAKHIYLGAGSLQRGTAEGNRLLAHELVHTVQQSQPTNTTPVTRLDVSQPGDPAEAEADRIADQVSNETRAAVASPMPVTAARKMISRAPMKTNGGEFEVKNYDKDDADKDNDTDKDVGAHIDIHFTPAEDIRSEKISFIQIMKTLDDGKPYLFENEKARSTKEGWALDRLAGMKSPNYAEQNTGAAGGKRSLGAAEARRTLSRLSCMTVLTFREKRERRFPATRKLSP